MKIQLNTNLEKENCKKRQYNKQQYIVNNISDALMITDGKWCWSNYYPIVTVRFNLENDFQYLVNVLHEYKLIKFNQINTISYYTSSNEIVFYNKNNNEPLFVIYLV